MVGRLDEGCLLLVLLNMVIHQILPKLDHELCGIGPSGLDITFRGEGARDPQSDGFP
jgi:hypothetical protein